MNADWIQHVLDTDGEPYLQTPEDDIPILSLLLLDVLGFFAIAAAVPALAAWVGSKHLKREEAWGEGKACLMFNKTACGSQASRLSHSCATPCYK